MLLLLLASAASAVAPAHAATPSFEQAVLVELNRARERPQEVAEELRRYRRTLRGLISHQANGRVRMATVEGASAVDEAIAFLERQRPLPRLARSILLGHAARTLMAEQALTGSVGHYSRDGRNPGGRVRAAGGGDAVGETIAYGFADPAAVVHQLIVDDGVRDRGHRALIYAGEFRFAGVGCASHPRYRQACTIDFSASPDGHRRPITYASR